MGPRAGRGRVDRGATVALLAGRGRPVAVEATTAVGSLAPFHVKHSGERPGSRAGGTVGVEGRRAKERSTTRSSRKARTSASSTSVWASVSAPEGTTVEIRSPRRRAGHDQRGAVRPRASSFRRWMGLWRRTGQRIVLPASGRASWRRELRAPAPAASSTRPDSVVLPRWPARGSGRGAGCIVGPRTRRPLQQKRRTSGP